MITKSIKIGDKLVVNGFFPPATIEEIILEADGTDRVQLKLDWQERGKSKVWLHDQHKTWYFYENNN